MFYCMFYFTCERSLREHMPLNVVLAIQQWHCLTACVEAGIADIRTSNITELGHPVNSCWNLLSFHAGFVISVVAPMKS